MKTAAIAIVLTIAGPAAALGQDWPGGEWCDPESHERLLIDEFGLGFNEHTICTWDEGRPESPVFDTTALCANIYLNGDEIVRMDERRVRLFSDDGAARTIMVVIEDGAPAAFSRCDE